MPIGQRPAEAEGRLVPGHHEGDLLMGSLASNSAVGTIVERMTGYLTLLHLPDGHHADAVADAVIDRHDRPAILVHPHPDLGQRHAKWPATPASPAPPASRSTSPTPTRPGSAAATRTSTACSANTSPRAPTSARCTPAQLQAIQDELNDRPRKRFGYHTPREELDRLLAENQTVATTP